ncbi:MAG: beta-galactosidase GalA [Verrucomicrobiota bacterium]
MTLITPRLSCSCFGFVLGFFLLAVPVAAPSAETAPAPAPGRERLLMDFGWRFAFGNPSDPKKDFGFGLGYFSDIAKTGYGDGAASVDFDDGAWRRVDLPHDWAVEAPFDGRAGHSHGYKAVGRNFPDTSIGWYRRKFQVPASDLGRRISLVFDGVFRDSKVWVNGHYLGGEPSGYLPAEYNISEFLNYGGENTVAVRVDASREEGWFYEGAGIYRHAWLVKTDPLHVESDGIFVSTDPATNSGAVRVVTAVRNEHLQPAEFQLTQLVFDPAGRLVASNSTPATRLPSWDRGEYEVALQVPNPQPWSIESPALYRLVTLVSSGGTNVDRCETAFGIRTIRFDPDAGFFLNGRRVELQGANNHQDHAGVGVALPDSLQDFRVRRLKEFGINAYRSSHNPPNPELLDACDRLGMLVIDENRLMGTSAEQLQDLERMIRRDRNHPSVILWSVGNEEWGIEGNPKGARITATMQAVARNLDPTRRSTVAISGGWGGSSTTTDVVGYNYIKQSNPDQQHAKFPNQPGVGTEETTTQGTRGIYVDDRPKAHLSPQEHGDSGANCEVGWKFYAARPYLAGLFYWTGFDYRGESTPFGYPAIGSQFGLLDTCGFPKDSAYYLKSWWTGAPLVHAYPHWNWPDRAGKEIDVRVFSNCEEVELLLNGRSAGRKAMERNGHLDWKIVYEPGTLLVRGYNAGKTAAEDRIETTGAPAAVRLSPDRAAIRADREDATPVAVEILDAQGRVVPVAGNQVAFEIEGQGRIIGVGNGDPSCHEPDRCVEFVSIVTPENWRRKEIDGVSNRVEVALAVNDSDWARVFREDADRAERGMFSRTNVFRADFQWPPETLSGQQAVTLQLRDLGGREWVYLNGELVGEAAGGLGRNEFRLDPSRLIVGTNTLAVLALPRQGGGRERGSMRNPAVIRVSTPPGEWKRSAFNGLAQVIVQSSGQPGSIRLHASSPGLRPATVEIAAQPTAPRPVVE